MASSAFFNTSTIPKEAAFSSEAMSSFTTGFTSATPTGFAASSDSGFSLASTIIPPTTSSPTNTTSITPIPTTYPSGAPLSRWLAVDDSDTVRIQYTGDWVAITDTTQYNSYGNYGTPYQGTLRAITNGTGSVAFTINSTRGEITGTTNVANISGVVVDPKWFCTIDGSRFMPNDPSPLAQNNWPLCEWDGLSSGVHVITLNATSNGQAFFFDQLSYIPATGASFTNESIIVPWSDAKISYDNSWGGFSGTSMMTSTKGATWNFTFEGTSVDWYATLPAQYVQMQTSSMATYSIDNGTPVFFNTGTLPSGLPTQFNQLQLKTPELTAGSHTLSVQFLGNTSTAPLFLESLIVHNTVAADAPTTFTTSTTSSMPYSTSPPSERGSRKTPTGAIAGAAVGGVAVLIIIILTIWCFLYKARKKRLSEQLLDIEEPPPPIPHPYTLEPKDNDSVSPPHSHSSDTLDAIYGSFYGPATSKHREHRNTVRASLPPTSTSKRSTLPRPPSLQHRLQLHNNSESLSDLSDPSPGQNEIIHQDSGIRLREEGVPGPPPVEYPPVYTPR